jgi:hypothetical protein
MLYLWLIIFLARDGVFVDLEAYLVTDFENLKIKSVQSFGDYKGMVCVHVFIWLSVRTCMNIYVCNILKREIYR